MRVRYYGPIGRLSGYGRAGTDLCGALLAAGVELEIRPIERRPHEAKVAFDGGPCQALLPYMRHEHELSIAPDAIIVHTLPMDCKRVQDIEQTRDPGLDPTIPWIAYTTWEGSSPVPPQMRQALADFDAVWVPSMQTAAMFAPVRDVEVVPHSFDATTLQMRRPESSPGAFRFYYMGAWNSRKNPAGLLRAWAMAFTPGDPVELHLYSHASSETFAVALHQTGLQRDEMAPVRHVATRFTEAEMYALHASGDCFVSATRGEAWDLPAFDAMLAGRHIIHPRNLGSDDYLGATTADLYRGFDMPASVDVLVTERMDDGVKLQIVGAQGLSSRSTWQEPDLVQLAALMRETVAAQRRTLTLQYNPADRFSYEVVGKLALSLIEDLT